MALSRPVRHGLAWTSAGRIVAQITSFAVTLILARWLSPDDFGLMAMVAVFSGYVTLVGELGLGAALVQRREIGQAHLAAVFWVNLAAGVVLGAAVLASAPLVAAFYEAPRVTPVVRVVALVVALAPLGTVHQALLARQLRFGTLALVEVVSTLGSSAVALLVASRMPGVHALWAKLVAATALQLVALWGATRFRPTLGLDRAALRDLLGYGLNTLGASSIHYWSRRVDDLLIGRVLGASALGLYDRAYSTMLLPVSEISGPLSRVMFPALSQLQHEPARVREAYLQVVRALSAITFPLMALLAVLAHPFVLVVYGERWLPIVPTLRILCVVGAFQSVGTTVGWLYQSQGRVDWMLRWGSVASVLMALGFAVGVWWGSIEAVALAYAIVCLGICAYPQFAIPGRLVGLTPLDVLRAVTKPLMGAAGAMGVAGWVCGSLGGETPAAQLGIAFLAGAAAHLGVLGLLGSREPRELARRLRRRLAWPSA